ncbi:MAG: septum formation protein Maf [Ilumatobacter sp.]|nr:septum formation protein Maf [Ilumatobacter sp.]
MITLPPGVQLVLASASARRSQLLARAGVDFEVRAADIDESPQSGERPAEYVRRLASEKGDAVMRPGDLVLSADTTVDIDGEILEKPTDDADVERMLRLLSGRAHDVHTGVRVAGRGTDRLAVVTTQVVFVELTSEMIDWYVATGDGLGKAGAYGIQGAAGAFVRRVEGSVTNVIGLPMAETIAMLRLALAPSGC